MCLCWCECWFKVCVRYYGHIDMCIDGFIDRKLEDRHFPAGNVNAFPLRWIGCIGGGVPPCNCFWMFCCVVLVFRSCFLIVNLRIRLCSCIVIMWNTGNVICWYCKIDIVFYRSWYLTLLWCNNALHGFTLIMICEGSFEADTVLCH